VKRTSPRLNRRPGTSTAQRSRRHPQAGQHLHISEAEAEFQASLGAPRTLTRDGSRSEKWGVNYSILFSITSFLPAIHKSMAAQQRRLMTSSASKASVQVIAAPTPGSTRIPFPDWCVLSRSPFLNGQPLNSLFYYVGLQRQIGYPSAFAGPLRGICLNETGRNRVDSKRACAPRPAARS
jgi:hypothetical protein